MVSEFKTNRFKIWTKVFLSIFQTEAFWAFIIMSVLCVGMAMLLGSYIQTTIDAMGGGRQIIIDVGRELKDIKREIDKP